MSVNRECPFVLHDDIYTPGVNPTESDILECFCQKYHFRRERVVKYAIEPMVERYGWEMTQLELEVPD